MGETPAWCIQLYSFDYREGWDLQTRLVSARKEGSLDRDIFLILEHLPVFTLGRNGRMDNLKVSEEGLSSSGIQVIRVERGGDITYHGPGQLVIYPIIDLQENALSVADHVSLLEEIMIRTASDFGVAAVRRAANRGVWVEDRKLGSVGVAVRRGIAFHGLALNVDLSLAPFEWINPCGLSGVRMTSLEKESSGVVSVDEVRTRAKTHMEECLGVRLEEVTLEDLFLKMEP
jgi:lipoate-protein ligase B